MWKICIPPGGFYTLFLLFYMRRLFAAPVLPKLCDGMGTAQIQSARFYKGTVDNNGAITEADLIFTGFPTVGSVTTYDSTSFCPDSASTATSIATGHKTESGVINMSPWTRDVPYEIIAENLADGKAICHTINHKLADLTKVL